MTADKQIYAVELREKMAVATSSILLIVEDSRKDLMRATQSSEVFPLP